MPTANQRRDAEVPHFILILGSDTTVFDVWLLGISIPSRGSLYKEIMGGENWVPLSHLPSLLIAKS